jgi:hypothetical protein
MIAYGHCRTLGRVSRSAYGIFLDSQDQVSLPAVVLVPSRRRTGETGAVPFRYLWSTSGMRIWATAMCAF